MWQWLGNAFCHHSSSSVLSQDEWPSRVIQVRVFLVDYSSNQASQLESFNVLKPHIWNFSLLALQSQFCSNPKGNLIYCVETTKFCHRTNLSEFTDSWHFYSLICFQVWTINRHWGGGGKRKKEKKKNSKFNREKCVITKPSSHRHCLPVTWDTRSDSLLCGEPAVFLWKPCMT